MRHLTVDLSALEEELDAMAAISRDIDTVKLQISQMKVCKEHLLDSRFM